MLFLEFIPLRCGNMSSMASQITGNSTVCTLKVMIYQVAGNSLANRPLESRLSKTESLIETAKAKFSDAQIYIAEALPCDLKNAQTSYIIKMEAYNQRVPSLCDSDRVHWLEHSDPRTVTPNTHARDRIHRNDRGISFLVRNYKLKVSADLGLRYLQTARGTGFPQNRHSTSPNGQNEQSVPPVSRSDAHNPNESSPVN